MELTGFVKATQWSMIKPCRDGMDLPEARHVQHLELLLQTVLVPAGLEPELKPGAAQVLGEWLQLLRMHPDRQAPEATLTHEEISSLAPQCRSKSTVDYKQTDSANRLLADQGILTEQQNRAPRKVSSQITDSNHDDTPER